MFGIRLRRIAAFIAISLMVAGYGAPVFAAEVTTVADIRAATNFASQKGWCTVKKDPTSADCQKQTTYCDAKDWSSFIDENVVYQGGIPTQRKASGSTAPAVSTPGYYANPVTKGDLLPTEIYTYLRKDPKNASLIPALTEAACFCDCQEGDSDAACQGLAKGTPVRFGGDRLYTREECTSVCKGRSPSNKKCAGTLPTIEAIDSSSAEGRAAAAAAEKATDIRMMCFTKDACAKADGVWEAYIRCSDGEGRCIALEPEVELNTPIGGKVSIRGFNQYVVAAYRYLLSIAIVLATVMFIWGGFIYLVGSSGVGSITTGKSIMVDSIIGLILLLSATAILRTLNPALTTLSPIKVYMVNTQSFISTAYCRDLADKSLRLADAGETSSKASYEEVSKKEDAFNVTPDQALCGHQYYIQTGSGGSCAGTKCPTPAEVCTSCASGEPVPCQSIKSTRMVCDRQVFAGTIDYEDGRYPISVHLFLLCDSGQSTGSNAVSITRGASSIMTVALGKIAKTSGSAQSDEYTVGQSMYRFEFTTDDITRANTFCADKGGFRGALLGVQYNASSWTMDNFALLSRKNCSAAKEFDGYSNGSLLSDLNPGLHLAEAFHCGKNKNPSRFINPQQDYWSKEELIAAAEGRQAISCNFALNEESAPQSPATTEPYCPVSAVKADQCVGVPQCASAVASGGTCRNGDSTCCTSDAKQCICVQGACSYTGVGSQNCIYEWRCQ